MLRGAQHAISVAVIAKVALVDKLYAKVAVLHAEKKANANGDAMVGTFLPNSIAWQVTFTNIKRSRAVRTHWLMTCLHRTDLV